MAQYIDKTALLEEIEKKLNSCKTYSTEYVNGKKYALKSILSFLDTLEVKEVDFEKIWKEYFKYRGDVAIVNVKRLAKHFFELGLKAQYSSIGFPNIDDILKEKGVDPDSKEAKIIKEAYFVAIDKAFENFKKGE